MSETQQEGITRRGFLKALGFGGASALGGFLGARGGAEPQKENEPIEGLKIPLIVGAAFADSPENNGVWGKRTQPLKGVPVSLVEITVPEGPGKTIRKTSSDENGIWFFDQVPHGLYRISADVGGRTQGNPEFSVTKETKIAFGGIIGVNPKDLLSSRP